MMKVSILVLVDVGLRFYKTIAIVITFQFQSLF